MKSNNFIHFVFSWKELNKGPFIFFQERGAGGFGCFHWSPTDAGKFPVAPFLLRVCFPWPPTCMTSERFPMLLLQRFRLIINTIMPTITLIIILVIVGIFVIITSMMIEGGQYNCPNQLQKQYFCCPKCCKQKRFKRPGLFDRQRLRMFILAVATKQLWRGEIS